LRLVRLLPLLYAASRGFDTRFRKGLALERGPAGPPGQTAALVPGAPSIIPRLFRILRHRLTCSLRVGSGALARRLVFLLDLVSVRDHPQLLAWLLASAGALPMSRVISACQTRVLILRIIQRGPMNVATHGCHAASAYSLPETSASGVAADLAIT
jgi:hypothetical protein